MRSQAMWKMEWLTGHSHRGLKSLGMHSLHDSNFAYTCGCQRPPWLWHMGQGYIPQTWPSSVPARYAEGNTAVNLYWQANHPVNSNDSQMGSCDGGLAFVWGKPIWGWWNPMHHSGVLGRPPARVGHHQVHQSRQRLKGEELPNCLHSHQDPCATRCTSAHAPAWNGP